METWLPTTLGKSVSHAPTALMHGSRPQGHTRHVKAMLRPCSQEHSHSDAWVSDTKNKWLSSMFSHFPRSLKFLRSFYITFSLLLQGHEPEHSNTSGPRFQTYSTSGPRLQTYSTSGRRLQTYSTSGPRLQTCSTLVALHLEYVKTSYINQNWTQEHLNLEPVLILTLTKIRPWIEVLACQKQAQSSH
jgi:hypothetical protein